MAEWTKSKYAGLRYREHATKTIGVGRSKRPLRYYVMTFKWQGKTHSEALGWEGEYVRDEEAARKISQKLRDNRKDNTPPFTLAEYRNDNAAALEAKTQEEQIEALKNITFGEIFAERYLPQVQQNRRSVRGAEGEESLFRLWISPAIGSRPMREIMPLHLEAIKKAMLKAGRSARSIQYCLAIVRQVFNFAAINRIFIGLNPAGKTGGVKRPKLENSRTRFLSRQEASDLLAELARRSQDLYDMALFSLYTGARAGEVFSLQWADFNLSLALATLKGTKSGKNRTVYFTDDVKAMLKDKKPGAPDDLVFPGRDGKKIVQISDSFNRAVASLKLNEGVTDRRQKVIFHTLRHTYASWLAIDGVDLYHIKELLGHSTITLTERYSHLSDSVLKQAALRIQNG